MPHLLRHFLIDSILLLARMANSEVCRYGLAAKNAFRDARLLPSGVTIIGMSFAVGVTIIGVVLDY